jgi:hypothetical protein
MGCVHICFDDLTPVLDRSDCPDNAKHTAAPAGYGGWFEWAERMSETHDQEECPGCGRLKIWTPKETIDGQA